MKQLTVTKEVHSQMSTCEWYQLEKEAYALSSPLRPEMENTLNCCFRQTSFPNLLNEDADLNK